MAKGEAEALSSLLKSTLLPGYKSLLATNFSINTNNSIAGLYHKKLFRQTKVKIITGNYIESYAGSQFLQRI
jgi:hypothetical protein